jgi:integrase
MMAPVKRRRSPGEGSVWAYTTKAGQRRYAIGYVVAGPDGASRNVTRRRGPGGERWTTYLAASRALREALARAERGEHVDPSRQPVAAYLAEWGAGLRLAPSTVASYRKNCRLHIEPYIGGVPLAALTTARIDAMYRQLEREGRRDHLGRPAGKPLSARTVRYVHTILRSALAAAVDSGRLAYNPAARAHPPTARQARPPEMHPWTAEQLTAFLAWAAGDGHPHAPAWRLLATTLARCRKQAGETGPPVIRLHDLRHTHATLLLSAGTPVKVVSERLGHASPVITMSVYAHVLPGGQRAAADAFDKLLGRADA